MEKLSLCMIVKNEEEKILRCLESVQGIVDEIIIVDTGSTDNTKLVVSEYNVKVYDFKWTNNFAEARNFSLAQSTCEWNLVLDADEYIVNDCKEEVKEFISNNRSIGRICRVDEFHTNNEIKYSKAHLSRLLPHNVFYEGKIHEQIVSKLPRKNINILVEHDGYVKENKTERNLTLLLEELKNKPQDSYINYQIAKQYYLNKDYYKANKFFSKAYIYSDRKKYFYPLLVVDYLYCLIFLKDFNKGLKIIKKEEKDLRFFTDFHFVCGLFFMDLVFSDVNKYQKYFKLIEQKYIRCLEIGEMIDYDSVQGTGSYLAFYNLGVYNEVIGNTKTALFFYEEAAKLGYQKAEDRIFTIKKGR